MKNKFLIIVLCLSFALMCAEPFAQSLEGIGGTVFRITGLYFLFINGTFIYTSLYRYAGIGTALLILGVMCKIMHFPFSDPLVLSGLGCIWTLYLVHFIKKERKKIADYAKLFFICAEVLLRIFKIMRLDHIEPQWIAPYDLLFALFLFYYIFKIHRPARSHNV
jgi:hypothetical protein